MLLLSTYPPFFFLLNSAVIKPEYLGELYLLDGEVAREYILLYIFFVVAQNHLITMFSIVVATLLLFCVAASLGPLITAVTPT